MRLPGHIPQPLYGRGFGGRDVRIGVLRITGGRTDGDLLRTRWPTRLCLPHLCKPFPQPLLSLKVALTAPVAGLSGPVGDGAPELAAAARCEKNAGEDPHRPTEYERP